MASVGGSSFVSYSLFFAEAVHEMGCLRIGRWSSSGGDRVSGAGRSALSVRKVVDDVWPRRNGTTPDMGYVMRYVTLARRTISVVLPTM